MPTHARHRASSTTRPATRGTGRRPTAALRLALLTLLVPALLGLTQAGTGGRSAVAENATRTWIGGSQTVEAGRKAVLTAALATGEEPVAGRKVVVYQHTPSGWRGLTSGTTDSRGRIRVAVTPSGTTRYGAGFAGDGEHARSATPKPVTVTVKKKESTFAQRLLAEAARHKGKPYRYGAAGPDSFDCSGFVMYVFGQLGKKLPHNSRAMYDASQKIPLSELRPGDLVFTKHGGRIGHVGIFAGDGMQWHSPQSGDVVKHSSLYSRDIVAGRIA